MTPTKWAAPRSSRRYTIPPTLTNAVHPRRPIPPSHHLHPTPPHPTPPPPQPHPRPRPTPTQTPPRRRNRSPRVSVALPPMYSRPADDYCKVGQAAAPVQIRYCLQRGGGCKVGQGMGLGRVREGWNREGRLQGGAEGPTHPPTPLLLLPAVLVGREMGTLHVSV